MLKGKQVEDERRGKKVRWDKFGGDGEIIWKLELRLMGAGHAFREAMPLLLLSCWIALWTADTSVELMWRRKWGDQTRPGEKVFISSENTLTPTQCFCLEVNDIGNEGVEVVSTSKVTFQWSVTWTRDNTTASYRPGEWERNKHKVAIIVKYRQSSQASSGLWHQDTPRYPKRGKKLNNINLYCVWRFWHNSILNYPPSRVF